MDGSLHAPPRANSFGALFGEDFGVREAAPEPEIIEPTFSADELASARDAAWRDGHLAALQEAASSDAAATRQALEALAEIIQADHAVAIAHAEEVAESVARLLLDCLAAVFPQLSAQYGEAEVLAIIRTVLPPLTQEPTIAVRAHPRMVAAVTEQISHLDPDIIARIQVTECEAVAPGDVRIAWHNGSAIRDAAALWEQVAGILAPAGLLRVEAKIKECVDAC